jgi:hypothetical protein
MGLAVHCSPFSISVNSKQPQGRLAAGTGTVSVHSCFSTDRENGKTIKATPAISARTQTDETSDLYTISAAKMKIPRPILTLLLTHSI